MSKKILIYTKKGDKGLTSLIGGKRLPKFNIQVESYGTVDELNSNIGLLREHLKEGRDKDFLLDIQKHLYIVQTQLAVGDVKLQKKFPPIKNDDIISIEKEIDIITLSLPELKSFIIPGGSIAVATCHVVRCVCRRAERLVVQLDQKKPVAQNIIPYLNRLSDYFFTLARKTAHVQGVKVNNF